jgi:glyoxylase-like metal-dependent hydrolase (beta-lactamase superfamily II)/predicted ester cyclase
MATTEPRRRASAKTTEKVVRAYFDALARRDVDGIAEAWADGGREHIRGQVDTIGPAGVREFFTGLFAAVPDWRLEIVTQTTQADRSAVQWRATGTFAGADLMGIAATGDRIELEGADVLTVADGKIVSNDAFTDNMAFARQLGMMPPQGSTAEQRMTGLFNRRTAIARRIVAPNGTEEVAEGVWRLQGEPGKCNVYFVRDGDGVLMFDAGAKTMRKAVAAAAAQLGGLTRIVLGHGHTDHRGTAPYLGVPVLCHADEVADAEGSGGWRYWDETLGFLPVPQRQIHKLFHRRFWDGGPVPIAQTLAEGDEVAGFAVVHLPGHAPGQIALWREGDRVALTTDVFYTLDMWGRDSEPHLPDPGYNLDTGQARASLRKLAALDPAVAWPGHARPVTGDVRGRLERAAQTS